MVFNDEQLDRTIGALLRGGVILAASVVLAGGIWHLAQAGLSAPDFHHFRGEPADLRSVSGIVAGAFRGSALSLVQLGLLLLIATPIARVGFSVFAFAMQRDRLYVAITLIVLAILLTSLFGLAAAQQ